MGKQYIVTFLGLKRRSCTPAEVRKAFRRWSLTNHPDKKQGDEYAARLYAVVNTAREEYANRKGGMGYFVMPPVKLATNTPARGTKRKASKPPPHTEFNFAERRRKFEEKMARERAKDRADMRERRQRKSKARAERARRRREARAQSKGSRHDPHTVFDSDDYDDEEWSSDISSLFDEIYDDETSDDDAYQVPPPRKKRKTRSKPKPKPKAKPKPKPKPKAKPKPRAKPKPIHPPFVDVKVPARVLCNGGDIIIVRPACITVASGDSPAKIRIPVAAGTVPGTTSRIPGFRFTNSTDSAIIRLVAILPTGYTIQDSDVVYTHTLELWECITNVSLNVRSLTGNNIRIRNSKYCLYPGYKFTASGQGLPTAKGRSDLIVKFCIKYPKTLSPRLKAQICTLKKYSNYRLLGDFIPIVPPPPMHPKGRSHPPYIDVLISPIMFCNGGTSRLVCPQHITPSSGGPSGASLIEIVVKPRTKKNTVVELKGYRFRNSLAGACLRLRPDLAPGLSLRGNDVVRRVEITLWEAITGVDMYVDLINGARMHINTRDKCIVPGHEISITGGGLPDDNGDLSRLIVHFVVRFPVQLDQATKSTISTFTNPTQTQIIDK